VVAIVLCACLCREGEGNIFTAWFSNDHLLLVNGVGSINKLGNIEALVLNLVLTLNLGDLNSLGHTDSFWGRVSQRTGHLERGSDERDLVCLSLVLLSTHLVFSVTISRRAISRCTTSSHLHSLRLLIISNLGGGARSSHIFSFVLIGADLSVHCGRGLLTDGEDTIKAIVIVYDLLDCKSDGGHLFSEGRHTDLSIDGGVCIPAIILWGITISWCGG